MKLKIDRINCFVFFIILLGSILFYWQNLNNYFFSDDFHWLGRAVLTQDSFVEIFTIEGRDFNPIFLILLGIIIKFFGLSPIVFRLLGLFVFSTVAWMFFYFLRKHFKIHPLIAFSVTSFSVFSVFISEVALNLSAFVYSLSFLFYFAALLAYFNKSSRLKSIELNTKVNNEEKNHLIKSTSTNYFLHNISNYLIKNKGYLFFMTLAFFCKETIIIGLIPLFFYEREKKARIFLFSSGAILVFLRISIQLLSSNATTSSYSEFLSFDKTFYKLYFIITRSINLSPYSLALPIGISLIIIIIIVITYFSKKNRDFLFFFILWIAFSCFFAFLPKLTSRYIYYCVFGSWGVIALLFQYFSKKNRFITYVLIILLPINLLYNFPLVQLEIEDYRILGDFSHQFLDQQKKLLHRQLTNKTNTKEVLIYKPNNFALANVYRQIIKRNNLSKLLPFRQNSIGGVIELRFMIPLIFYPESIAHWVQKDETSTFVKGEIKD